MAWKKSAIAFDCVPETEGEETDVDRMRECIHGMPSGAGMGVCEDAFHSLWRGRRFAVRFPLGHFAVKDFATVSKSRGKRNYSSNNV